MGWREDPRVSGPWRDSSDDPADRDYPTSYTPAPRTAGHRPGYGGFAARPPAGGRSRPPALGRHTGARRRDVPRRAPQVVLEPAAAPAAPLGFSQRMRAAARNHTGAAALTAAAVVGTGVGVGMFGFAPFASPTATPPSANAAMPAAPPVVAMAGSATPVQHHARHTHPSYLGRHRKAEPRPATRTTPQISGSAAGAAATASAPTPQGAGSGSSTPAASSAPAPTVSSTPKSSTGGSGSQTGPGSGSASGSGHSSGGHSGNGGLLSGVTGLLGGLGL